MKKTILKSAILAAVASLTFAPYVSAHHPALAMAAEYEEETGEEFPGALLAEENISDQHNDVIDAMLEEGDNDFMATTAQGTDSETQTQVGGDAVASQDSAQSSMAGDSPASNVNQSAITNASQARAGAGAGR